jgi:DNA-directed RNA polymerase beta subunit
MAAEDDFYLDPDAFRQQFELAFSSELKLTEEEKLFQDLVRTDGFSKNIIGAFNHWIRNILPQQIEARRFKITIGEVMFTDVKVNNPSQPAGTKNELVPLLPKTCRDKQMSYSGDLTATVVFVPSMGKNKKVQSKNIVLCKIPIMLGSEACWLSTMSDKEKLEVGECFNDPLGYYIIKGTERVVMIQEKLRTSINFVFVADTKGHVEGRITNSTVKGTTIVSVAISKQWQSLKVGLQHLGKQKHIPLFMIYSLLGVPDYDQAMDMILAYVQPEHMQAVIFILQSSIAKASKAPDIISYIAKKRKQEIQSSLVIAQKVVTDIFSKMGEILEASGTGVEISDYLEGQSPYQVYRMLSSSLIYSIVKDIKNVTIESVLKAAIDLVMKYFENLDFGDSDITTFSEDLYKTMSKDDRFANNIRTITEKLTGNANIINDIRNDLFANIEGDTEKLQHLSHLAARVCEYLIGVRELDNRDSWSNKRVESAARSMEQLMNGLFNVYMQEVKDKVNVSKTAVTDVADICRHFEHGRYTEFILKSFGSNSWGPPNSFSKENIVETLRRETPLAVYSQIARVNTPASRQAKQPSIRMNQPSQQGGIDNYDTPEGENNGLVKSLTLTAYITNEASAEVVIRLIQDECKEELTESQDEDHVHPLLVNGRLIAWCNGLEVRKQLIAMRRKDHFPKGICILFNDKDFTLEVYCDGARLTRPLLVVDPDGQLVIDKLKLWGQDLPTLIQNGCLEYVDLREQEMNYLYVAKSTAHQRRAAAKIPTLKAQMETLKAEIDRELVEGYPVKDKEDHYKTLETEYLGCFHTHCEIHPVQTFSIAAGLVPLPNHGQGPRLTYQCSMFKQALGRYHSNHHLRFDSSFKVHENPTRSFFETIVSSLAGLDQMPTGRNFLVAFMALDENGEDAIVANEDAFSLKKGERFAYTKYFTHKAVARKVSQKFTEYFGRPSKVDGEPDGRYAAIDENGLPRLGSFIRPGDCVIGMFRHNEVTGETTNACRLAGIGEEGYVDRVMAIYDANHQPMVKVKLRQARGYMPGDKMASRYSQKGVLNKLVSSKYLPRIVGGPNDGVVPALFINPHAIPSRMTIGKLIEFMAGKASAITGERFNSTVFSWTPDKMAELEKTLKDNGFAPDGTEEMVTPDGKPLRVRPFVGLCTYNALRHHVLDKEQKRARGPIKPMTHQAVGGRQNEGGIRLGEMERDCIASHGAAMILRERLCRSSDPYRLTLCTRCGNIPISDHHNNQHSCRICGGAAEFGVAIIPYPLKLLLHLIQGLGINMTFQTARIGGKTEYAEEKFCE